MPYKTFVAGEEALAADVNSYLVSQTVARFPNAGARTAALTAPALGQLSSLDSTPGAIQYWSGTAWVDAAAPNLERFVDAAPALDVGPGQAFAYDFAPITIPRTGPVVVSLICTCTSTIAGSGYLRIVTGATGGAPSVTPDAFVGMPGGAFNSTVPLMAAWPSLAAGTSFGLRLRLFNTAGGGTIRLAYASGSVRVGQSF